MTPVSKRDPRLISRATPRQPEKPPETGPQEVEQDDPQAYIQMLEAKIKELEDKQLSGLPRQPGYRVSPKGAISVYGIHANFPVTLYPDQWKRLFQHEKEITEFIEANKDVLNFKDDDAQLLAEKEDKRKAMGIVPRGQPRTQMIETAANTRRAA